MATGVVALTSDIKRRRWMREGLVQSASKSFWNTYAGSSMDSIVFQANNPNSSEGHTVVFDFDGNLSSKGIKGKNTAFGKGEQKRKFSDKLTVERYRLVVDNGDAFDAVDIGDLNISQHSDSRNKLGDLFIRFKDQSLFDSAQGNLIQSTGSAQAPTHTIDLGSSFTYATLQDIEATLKTSQGYTTGGIRRPLDAFRAAGSERPIWLFVIDAHMKRILMQDTAAVNGFATIMATGDVRGNNNRMITGIVGKVGNLLIVEADQFFGETLGAVTGWGMDDSETEISGLRQYSGVDPSTAPWTGQAGFDYGSATLHSRGIILGAGALQCAFGKQPDYKYQPSQDFAIKSESAVEFWMETRKANLFAENTDYKAAKIAGIDYGLVTVDLQVV